MGFKENNTKKFELKEFTRAGKRHVIDKIPKISAVVIPAASISKQINNMYKERLEDAVYGRKRKVQKNLDRKLKVLRETIKKEI